MDKSSSTTPPPAQPTPSKTPDPAPSAGPPPVPVKLTKMQTWLDSKPPDPTCQLDPQMPVKPTVCGGPLTIEGVCKVCGRLNTGV